eukprot:c28575_g2_i3 orf=443-1399(-)
MVGGGIRQDGGLPAISSTNIFSALESRRRKSSKKRSEKDKSDSKGKVSKSHSETQSVPQVWTPTPVTVKSWADCEDDDDYFATAAPPPPVWGEEDKPSEVTDCAIEGLSQGEESEGDEEIEEEVEDEHLSELSTEVASSKSAPPTPAPSREPDRQLSKKERKKKDLADFEAVLLELGCNKYENDTAQSNDEKKQAGLNDEANGEEENMESNLSHTESKSARRRKAKKEKSFKEGKDNEVPPTPDADGGFKDNDVTDDTNSAPDPKEVLKRIASLKKKKSAKESDIAAKAAAAEASVRAAKLAAAKKKEKNHYNQQPVR